MVGLYTINSPRRLFEKLEIKFTSFCDFPSKDGVLDVIFPLYHLREWICPGGYESYRNKPDDDRSPEEQLHAQLHAMPEYEVVRALCNDAKHYNDSDAIGSRSDVVLGLRAGLGRAGDSLGVTHFTVDGRDIRNFLWPVFEIYVAYFRP